MEQTALPFVSRSQPPPPSTLAPPPLETAATGTRSLQRFDIGRMRVVAAPAPLVDEAPAEETPSQPPEVSARTAPWPRFDMPAVRGEPRDDTRAETRGATQRIARYWPMPVKAAVTRQPFATLRDAAWAFAAAASLAVASSVASALVYLIAFP